MSCLMHGNRNYTGRGGGASAISDLTDVDIDDQTLDEGQVLKWNSANEKWVNEDESGGTTVIANPTGTPTEQLNAIQIGPDIYEIVGGGGSGASIEIFPITGGTNTTSRTFTFDRTPKKIAVTYDSADSSPWCGHWDFTWGDQYAFGLCNPKSVGQGATIVRAGLTYGADDKSFTVTGGNAFQAWNQSGSIRGGFMLVDYGEGDGTGGASKLADLEDVTITNPSYGDVLLYNPFTQKWENDGVGNMPSNLDYSNNVADKTRIDSILGQYVTNNYVSTFICRINVVTAYTSSNLDTKMVQGLPSGFDISDTKIPLQVYTSDTSSDVKFYLYKNGIYNKTAVPVGNYVIVGSYIPQWY